MKTISVLKNRFDIKLFKPIYVIKKTHDLISKDRLWQLPEYLQIEPTNQCNIECISCNRGELREFGIMKLSSFIHIVEQFDYLRMVKLQGMGEPLLNPDFFLMLEFLRNRGIKTYCATNGTLLNEKRRNMLVELCDIIEISLDSPDRGMANKLRKGLDFEQLQHNITKTVELDPAKEIRINFVLMNDNIQQLCSMVTLLKKLGVRYLNVIDLQNWGHEYADLKKLGAGNEKIQLLEKCKAAALKEGIYMCYEKKINKYCDCPWVNDRCFITWNGYVTPCCLRPNPDMYNLGNLMERTVVDIWNDPKYLALRKSLSIEKPLSVCKDCSYVEQQ